MLLLQQLRPNSAALALSQLKGARIWDTIATATAVLVLSHASRGTSKTPEPPAEETAISEARSRDCFRFHVAAAAGKWTVLLRLDLAQVPQLVLRCSNVVS